MRGSIVLVGILTLVAVAAFGEAYNVSITDRGTELIEWFTEVRIYAVDPDTDDRLSEEAAVILAGPENPIKLELDPGRYEFVVWMLWLSEEVHYFYFDVDDVQRTAIDLHSYEFPEELVVR